MEQYIPKLALVTEIKRRQSEHDKKKYDYASSEHFWASIEDGKILSSLDTLEVKEVDLEKAIDDYIYTNNGRKRMALELDWKQYDITFKAGKLINFAKHFFELGLKAQKDSIRHSMNEPPKYPCDILLITNVNNIFLYRYMENGRPVDKDTPYFHNILNGKCWYYSSDIINY